jgi:hypothetical protein
VNGKPWPCGRAAKAKLTAIINRGHVTCEARAKDRYGRTIITNYKMRLKRLSAASGEGLSSSPPTGAQTSRIVSARLTVLLLLALVPVLAGCATTSTTQPGQVQEVGPGTYKVGIGHTVRVGYEKEYEAISVAGQYCHAKGQKLVVVPTHDDTNAVTFRCESSSEPVTSPPSMPPPSN